MTTTSWMQTFLGKAFFPLEPDPADIEIQDIAHSLSLQCRYAGHCLKFLSVAEHSVVVAQHCSPENRLSGLLHDAAEAYICDVPRPLKRHLEGYAAYERTLQLAIAVRFSLPLEIPDEVKEIDNRILYAERDQNMAPSPRPWTDMDGVMPLPGLVLPLWSPEAAEMAFLTAFEHYTLAAGYYASMATG